jgi:hypothetical protein
MEGGGGKRNFKLQKIFLEKIFLEKKLGSKS